MSSGSTALNVLLAGVARGDEAAFERLYRQTSPRLYALCLGVLKRPELAEEVLQDVYTRIWRDAPRHAATVSNPLGWMGVMARNRAIDVLRKRARESREIEEAGPQAVAVSDPRDDPRERVQRLAESSALRRCLERLQESRRDAILLAFFEGLSHRELSESMAQPAGTVKSWIRRGLAQLRRCLER